MPFDTTPKEPNEVQRNLIEARKLIENEDDWTISYRHLQITPDSNIRRCALGALDAGKYGMSGRVNTAPWPMFVDHKLVIDAAFPLPNKHCEGLDREVIVLAKAIALLEDSKMVDLHVIHGGVQEIIANHNNARTHKRVLQYFDKAIELAGELTPVEVV